jgi:hypothetical protein
MDGKAKVGVARRADSLQIDFSVIVRGWPENGTLFAALMRLSKR